jgi:hypothetical protein
MRTSTSTSSTTANYLDVLGRRLSTNSIQIHSNFTLTRLQLVLSNSIVQSTFGVLSGCVRNGHRVYLEYVRIALQVNSKGSTFTTSTSSSRLAWIDFQITLECILAARRCINRVNEKWKR